MAQSKKKKNNNILRIVGAFVLVVLLISFCVTFVKQQIVLNNQQQQIARMKEENAKIEEEYRSMIKNVEDKNTLEYVDKYMREHFGMIVDGDTRIDIVEGE